ncbi:MAG: putative glycoside hydrolase [Polaribacter sp.]|uniref:putative glycoside hydrolase n=1 Tax=Polaribacter sp. TaxID=1920175 RepID=UPI0032637B81
MKSPFLHTSFFLISLFLMQAAFSQKDNHYPKFSWDKVPVAFHFGKKGDLLTKKEAKFIASHSNFVVLEKAHGFPKYRYSEESIAADAKVLKSLNKEIKVVFYWNAFLDYSMYKAHKEYQKKTDWWLKTQKGELDLKSNRIKRYDLSNPEFRNWWSNVAKENLDNKNIDGVFFDALNQVTNPGNKRLWGIEKYNAIQKGLKDLIKETRTKIGDGKIIVYNGIRSTPVRNAGNDFPDNTDAVMIEHFGFFNSKTKESMLKDIQEMEKAGKSGKIVVFKTWPENAWLNKRFMAKSEKEKEKISKQRINFALASFLAGAQKHSYFIYNWGYRLSMGSLLWYPELDKPLGKPLNEMQVNDWILTRKYKYADVWVDLENRKAKINWKK